MNRAEHVLLLSLVGDIFAWNEMKVLMNNAANRVCIV